MLHIQTPPGDATDASFDVHFNKTHTGGGKGGLFATDANWDWENHRCKVIFRAKSPYAPQGVKSKLDATGFGGQKTVFGISDQKVKAGKASCLVSNNDDRHGIATIELWVNGKAVGARKVELAIGEAKRAEFDFAVNPNDRLEFKLAK